MAFSDDFLLENGDKFSKKEWLEILDQQKVSDEILEKFLEKVPVSEVLTRDELWNVENFKKLGVKNMDYEMIERKPHKFSSEMMKAFMKKSEIEFFLEFYVPRLKGKMPEETIEEMKKILNLKSQF